MLYELLGNTVSVGLDAGVKPITIDLRRKFRLRIPDADVAATAMATNAVLLINDTAFEAAGGLNRQAVPLKTA